MIHNQALAVALAVMTAAAAPVLAKGWLKGAAMGVVAGRAIEHHWAVQAAIKE